MVDGELNAVVLACSLRPSPSPSSSELLGRQILTALEEAGVHGTTIRVVDHDIRPGVNLDMGNSDEWPMMRQLIMDADILVLATPTWLGQPSSVAQRVLERLDAELGETDDEGRMHTLGKVAIAAVVGNEDGAQHVYAILFQALNDVGFTLAGQAASYWNDSVGGEHRNYVDLDKTPDAVAATNRTVALHAAHVARLLKSSPYPAPH